MDPTYHEDDDVSLERQRVMTGEARDDLLVLYNLKKVSQLLLWSYQTCDNPVKVQHINKLLIQIHIWRFCSV